MTIKATTIITAGLLFVNTLAWLLSVHYGTLVSAATCGMLGLLMLDTDTNERRD